MKGLSKIWLNGRFVNWQDAKIHVLTHGLHYGTAIFEGMRCYNTIHGPAVFRMKDHYTRMLHGIKTYEFDIPHDCNELCQITKELIIRNKVKSCYIRPICYVGNKGIGIDITDAPFEFAIIPVPFGKYFGSKATVGITCGVSSWQRISATILSPHVKASANYLNSVLAKKEAVNDGFDEAIMLNEAGRVTEGTGENLFIIEEGKLVTPPLYDGVLAGITRDSVMDIAREMDITVEERPLLRDELYTADEVFLAGTAAEITPVICIDKKCVGTGKPGKLTKELQSSFFSIVTGRDERFVKWLDFVKG
jgi:branched-chain amino acid aminotransferase